MKFQLPLIIDTENKYEEGGSSSSGAKSCMKPPLSSLKMYPLLIDETNKLVSPKNNENSSNEKKPPAKASSIGRLSLMTDEQLIEYEQKNGRTIIDPETVDIKKLKRTIANRLSAQKSRLKKFQRIEEMEKKVKELEEHINDLRIQIESTRKTQEMSRMQNMIMEQRLDYLSKKSTITNKDIEKNKSEATWLREFLQMMKENVVNNEVEKMKSLYVVDHYDEHQLPALQNHQALFNVNSNGEHQNIGEMGGHHQETPGQFMNVEAFIGYHQGTNPAN